MKPCIHPEYRACPFRVEWNSGEESGVSCRFRNGCAIITGYCERCPLQEVCEIQCIEQALLSSLCLRKRELLGVLLRG